jgi:hydroxymethylbilane synthase
MKASIRIGTRGSSLAIAQTEMVMAAMCAIDPSAAFDVKVITSTGDAEPDAPLASLGLGVFTTAIENALLEKRIDLPESSRIGTSSPRRVAQLKHGRKDILFLPIRGNIETRLRKAQSPSYDGTILAAAGVHRLGMAECITEYLSPAICAPAPGQAAIAAQSRSEDREILSLIKAISHRPTTLAVTAERELLRAAGGGCQLPIGAHATLEGDAIRLFATVTPLDGSTSYRVEVTGPADDPEIASMAAYAELLAQGAGDLMHGVTQ